VTGDWRDQFRRGQRVKYVGLSGRADGPIGRIRGVSSSGVTVRWQDSGRVEVVHPDDIQAVTR
jgi:hypothetical protein